MGLIKYKEDMRTTSKFSFNVGYVFVGLVIGLVITGLFKGLITSENFPSVLDSLLYPACLFFGVGTARVVAENLGGVTRDSAGNTIPPNPQPKIQVNDVRVENAEAIIDTATGVSVSAPVEDEEVTYPPIKTQKEEVNTRTRRNYG